MEDTAVREFDHLEIKRARRRAGLTQYQLAISSGIPLDTIRMYEQGRVTPSVERLFLLADTLGCKLDDFAKGTDASCSETITAKA